MKKIIAAGLLSVLLVGCGEHDEEYFFKHQDKAETKLKSCEEKIYAAIEKNDEKAYEKAFNDKECHAANAALKKQRQLDYEKEVAERELKKQREEEARLKEIATEKAAILEQHKNATWQTTISEYLKVECNQGFLQAPSPSCAAWKEIYDEAVTSGKTELLQFSFLELKEKENEFCNLDKRSGSVCSVWEMATSEQGKAELDGLDLSAIETKKADYCKDGSYSTNCRVWTNEWNQKSEELIKHFLNEDEIFVQTYNSCLTEIDKIRQSNGSWDERHQGESTIRTNSPCLQAERAYTRRGMGYDPYKRYIAQ